MKLYKNTESKELKIKDIKTIKANLKKKKIRIKLEKTNDGFKYTYISPKMMLKDILNRLKIMLSFVLCISAMICFGIIISYATRPIVPVDIAANNFNFISEEVTEYMDLGDKNAVAYLVGKDTDTINENFMQYIEFSTNTYAKSYYTQSKSTMLDMAKLSERKYYEKEEKNGSNYKYSITYKDNNEEHVLIIDGKRFAYLVIDGKEFQENFKNILLQMRLREY